MRRSEPEFPSSATHVSVHRCGMRWKVTQYGGNDMQLVVSGKRTEEVVSGVSL
jgi:hypothetical protein